MTATSDRSHPIQRVAWVLIQLCLLPVAPARYLHDWTGYLIARYVVNSEIEDIRVRRRGYRLDWAVKPREDADKAALLTTLLLPVLLGLLAVAVSWPFTRVVYLGTPVTLDPVTRAVLEVTALQIAAMPWPRIRDLPRWRAWWPEEDTTHLSEVDES